jgi:hypothetical protein
MTEDHIVVLCGDGHTLSTATVYMDELLDVLSSDEMTGEQIVGNGVCDAEDTPVSGVVAAETVTSIHIVEDTGDPSTSPIIYSSDMHTDGTPILRVSDGNAIVVSWSNGPGRILQV